MTKTKKPYCKVGLNDSIFILMTIANQCLRDNNMTDEAKEMALKITNVARSYQDALAIVQQYVRVV